MPLPAACALNRVLGSACTRGSVGSAASMWSGRSRTGGSSSAVVQPRKSKSRAMMPPVKPHRMTSLSWPIRKPGPTQPAGVPDGDPVLGSHQLVERHAVDGVHLVGRLRVHRRGGSRHQPRIGVTAKLLGGSHSSGSSAKTSTPEGSRPVSSSASRSAASSAVSPGSIVPPGNETWPGWERMWWARSVSSRSGPVSPSPNSISTAPRRGSASSGGMNRVRSCTVIARAPASSGCSQSGRPGTPDCSAGGITWSVTAAPRGARRRGRRSRRPRTPRPRPAGSSRRRSTKTSIGTGMLAGNGGLPERSSSGSASSG